MADSYQHIFDRLLDITALFSISIKSFAIYIVCTKTAAERRHESYFILNVMVWNFIGNLNFTILHSYPMFPSTCYRLDGYLSRFVDNETFGHAIFYVIFVSILNCALALCFMFPYRYILFAFPALAAKIRPFWVYIFCGLLHLIFSFLLAITVILWRVSYDDYPIRVELEDRPLLFCFYPTGWRKFLFVGYFLVVMIGSSVIVMTFATLHYCTIISYKHAVHQYTIMLQRKILLNLVIFTNIIMVFGGIPMVMNLLLIAYPHFPHARQLEALLVVIVLNHGTISAIVTLIVFESYREAVSRIFWRIVAMATNRKPKVVVPRCPN